MDQTFLFKLIAVSLASFAGSLHCGAMCGGLVLAATPRFTTQMTYHGFRLAGYLLVGLIASSIGKLFSIHVFPIELEFISVIALTTVLIFSAVRLFLWNRLPDYRLNMISSLAQKGMHFGFKQQDLFQSSVLGFFTAFLPCGWFYTFAIIAAATQSSVQGPLVVFAFWLGTLPLLLGGGVFVQKIQSLWGKQGNQGLALFFLLMGLWSFHERIAALSLEGGHTSLICR